MRLIKTAALVAVFISACSTHSTDEPAGFLDNFQIVKQMENENHLVELYSTSALTTGHNELLLRIKDKTTGTYVPNASVSWMPIMNMSTMAHSCPFSAVETTTQDNSIYRGFIVFQMAQNDSEYWSLGVNYSVDGHDYSVHGQLDVAAEMLRTVNSFVGQDGEKYVVSLIAPKEPAVALNDMTALVYKMESMMVYQPVSGYTLKIDPRMPGMGNHGSPNNVDLTSTGILYKGKLSLTMTGFWRVNLILAGPGGDIIKGEPVTEVNPQSSLYFEIEF